MSSWKIILATLVIFGAGIVTGVFVDRASRGNNSGEVSLSIGPRMVQQHFLERMKKELALTPEQFNHLETVFRESRERMAVWWDVIGPEMEMETRHVREEVRNVLNSDQKRKYAELLREQQQHRPSGPPPADKRSKDGRRSGPRSSAQGTNKPAGPVSPAFTNAPAAAATNPAPVPQP